MAVSHIITWHIIRSVLIFQFGSTSGDTGQYFFNSHLEICDSSELRKYRKNFCPQKLVFDSANMTKLNSDCICVSGIWLILNRNCATDIVVAHEGCMLSPQIKAMKFLGNFGQDDFFSVVTNSVENIDYHLVRPITFINVQGSVWVFNGVLFKSESGTETYCVEKKMQTLPISKVNVMTRYEIHGKMSLQFECPPENYVVPVMPRAEYGIVNRDTSECEIDCDEQSTSALAKLSMKKVKEPEMPRKVYFRKPSARKLEEYWEKIRRRNLTQMKEQKRRLLKVKTMMALMVYLNERLMWRVLTQFMNKSVILPLTKPEFIPEASFRIMETLQSIVMKTCGKSVPKTFLEHGLIMFRVLYEHKGSKLRETLKPEEAADILGFLHECHNSLIPLEFSEDNFILGCNDEINFVKMQELFVPINVTRKYPENFFTFARHLVLEIPWNMIDLSVGRCIGSFAGSYIAYHKMEQAMEKLFTKDLKRLWKWPPNDGTFYTRIYGPFWRLYADNLEKCTDAVYMQNPRLPRLRRPDESVGGLRRSSKDRERIKHELGLRFPRLTPGKGYFEMENNRQIKKVTQIIASANLSCQEFNLKECVNTMMSS